jgi:cytochrome P450
MMNFFSEEFRRNPYPVYAQMREAAPVLREPNSGIWMLLDYESVRRALNDTEVFSSHISATAGHPTPKWMIFEDAPKHTRLRGLITSAFTPRIVSNLEPRIRELTTGFINKVIERGEMDLASDLTVPLPMMVVADMIGIPAEDWPRFNRWSELTLELSYTIRGISPAEEAAKAGEGYRQVMVEMSEYLPELSEARRREPKDDLLTRMVQAELNGERLSPEEILGFVHLLIVGGQETTTNLVNNAILSLLENPEQLAKLERNPELLGSAIEETLRYRSPLQWIFRANRREVTLQGATIPAGQLLITVLGSANRDGKQFRDAEKFDIKRDPNPHVAFGHGLHFCIGAALSRLEARVVLTEILSRLKNMSLASNTPWQPRKGLHVHGPTHLPIRFRAGQPVH